MIFRNSEILVYLPFFNLSLNVTQKHLSITMRQIMTLIKQFDVIIPKFPLLNVQQLHLPLEALYL